MKPMKPMKPIHDPFDDWDDRNPGKAALLCMAIAIIIGWLIVDMHMKGAL